MAENAVPNADFSEMGKVYTQQRVVKFCVETSRYVRRSYRKDTATPSGKKKQTALQDTKRERVTETGSDKSQMQT